jgi:hypothetical protein
MRDARCICEKCPTLNYLNKDVLNKQQAPFYVYYLQLEHEHPQVKKLRLNIVLPISIKARYWLKSDYVLSLTECFTTGTSVSPLGIPKFSLVQYSETFLQTTNLNLMVGRERAEPRTRTYRTGFSRFSSGSNQVQTLEPMWLAKKKTCMPS